MHPPERSEANRDPLPAPPRQRPLPLRRRPPVILTALATVWLLTAPALGTLLGRAIHHADQRS
jgi:hypothetical protein